MYGSMLDLHFPAHLGMETAVTPVQPSASVKLSVLLSNSTSRQSSFASSWALFSFSAAQLPANATINNKLSRLILFSAQLAGEVNNFLLEFYILVQ